ncbi:MAG: hypothetical protein O3A46_05025 [Candidatus Poribacteria bacterium]|nr:hypothetical protein [Candidatus Poribacteria bacterium]
MSTVACRHRVEFASRGVRPVLNGVGSVKPRLAALLLSFWCVASLAVAQTEQVDPPDTAPETTPNTTTDTPSTTVPETPPETTSSAVQTKPPVTTPVGASTTNPNATTNTSPVGAFATNPNVTPNAPTNTAPVGVSATNPNLVPNATQNAARSVLDVSRVQSQRPATFLDAILLVRGQAEADIRAGRYYAVFHDLMNILSGNAAARRYLKNEDYWRWTAASYTLIIIGQVLVFLAMGYRVRLMAMTFPRRPLGVVLIGVGVASLSLPVVAALYLSMVGIPFAVVLWTWVYAAAFVGKMGVFLSAGSLIFPFFGARSPIPFFPIYVVYSLLVFFNPVAIGTAVFLIANILGVGLATRTVFGFATRALRESDE